MPHDTELSPLSPQPIEVVLSLALVVALVFAVYAIWKIRRGDWTLAAGLTLIVLTFLVPYSGPVLAGYFGARNHLRGRRGAVTA